MIKVLLVKVHPVLQASEVLSSYSSMNNRKRLLNNPADLPQAASSTRSRAKDSGKRMQMSSRIESPINVLSKAVLLVSLLKDD